MAKADTPPTRRYVVEEAQVLFIARSGPDDIVAVDPKAGNRQITRAEDLLEREWHRNDIALVNVWRVDRNGKRRDTQQFFVEPTWSGSPAGEGLRYLTLAEKRWCKQENARILALANAKATAQFGKLLGRRLSQTA
jgi:hypothetical protein